MEYGAPGSLHLPRHNLVASFDLRPIGDETYGAAGAYTHLETHRVWFSDLRTCDIVPLEQIDPLVFSEVMRDVDLFVGVCSIGNSPEWEDNDAAAPFNDYWHQFAFGDLTQTAALRREMLAHLLPRLKIADVCSLRGRYLHVQGKLRSYKIHLGSGNILMEPNDQYLCIVPAGSGAAIHRSIFLPFEGDRTLAIILSKALMLAEDDNIKDPSIRSQIGRR